jgi:CBS domain-containing protein
MASAFGGFIDGDAGPPRYRRRRASRAASAKLAGPARIAILAFRLPRTSTSRARGWARVRLEIRASFCNEIAAGAVGLGGGDTVRVRDWMKQPVYTVKPRDSIEHARAILEEHRINQLPVIVKDNVVGIVTDRDLRDAFPSVFDSPGFTGGATRKPARDPDEVRVEEVMSAKVVTSGPDQPLEDAALLMRRERIGAIPVVEHERLVGIVTRSDVLGAFLSREHGVGDAVPAVPAKRGKQPGAKRGKQPGAKRGKQPDAKRGKQPDAKRGKQPGAKRGKQPGAKRGKQPGAKRGKQPDAKRGKQPDAKRGKRPGAKRAKRPGAKRAKQPGAKR